MRPAGNGQKLKSVVSGKQIKDLQKEETRRIESNTGNKKMCGIPSALTAAPDPIGLVKALLRKKKHAMLTGGLMAIISGTLAWLVLPSEKYTVKSTVLIPSQSPRILDTVIETQGISGDEYKRFQKTQLAQMMSTKVMDTAIGKLSSREDSIRELCKKTKDYKTFKGENDIVDFLQREVQVSIKEDSELMEVVLSGQHAEELAEVVNAIVSSYMEEIALKDQMKMSSRQKQLMMIKEQKEKELQEKRVRAKKMAASAGSDDRETLVIKQKLQIEQIAELERGLSECRTLKRKLEAEIEVRSKYPRNKMSSEIISESHDKLNRIKFLEEQPEVLDLKAQLSEGQRELSKIEHQVRMVSRNPENDPHLKKARNRVTILQGKLALMRDQQDNNIRADVVNLPETILDSTLEKLQFNLAIIQSTEDQLQADRNKLTINTNKLNIETIDLLTIQEEIETTRTKYRDIAAEFEKLSIEIQAPSRVQVIEKAKPPKQKEGKQRSLLIVFSSSAAFFIGMLLISYLEFRQRRLTSIEDVVQGLGIQLVGSLPSFINMRNENDYQIDNIDSAASHELNESIDALRTMVVHEARLTDTRAILITSALADEGKTSLAYYLSTSLARVGYKTIVIDADLRNPNVHVKFEKQNLNGLGEVMSGYMNIDQCIIQCDNPIISILTAGKSDQSSLRGMIHGEFTKTLKRLKESYDFVIIDSGPILPCAETTTIASHVDAVILSARRDVSRLPQMFEAYQRICGIDKKVLGAVVSGIPNKAESRGKYSAYTRLGQIAKKKNT